MKNILKLACCLLFLEFFCSAATHWYVDDDGLIKQEPKSIFDLQQPGDLITFLEQEKQATQLITLHSELLAKKDVLKPTDEEQVNVENEMFETDKDCQVSRKRLSEFDLYLSSVLSLKSAPKNINIANHIDIEAPLPAVLQKPFCRTDLALSMHSFDHVAGISERATLKGYPERGLINAVPFTKDVEGFGHRVHVALSKAPIDWLLLNLAGMYWRISGVPLQSVECFRRALHYSPSNQKDIGLINMANVLHRGKYSLDAAILIHTALETTSQFDIAYFTLGNIYASLGQFDLAEICYKFVEDIHPEFREAIVRKHAARCEQKINKRLEQQNRMLQKTLEELEDFQMKHQLLEDQQRTLLNRSRRPRDKGSNDSTPSKE